MKSCMSTMCIDTANLYDKIHSICKAGFQGIELWTKDFNYKSARETKKVLDDYGVKAIQTSKLDGWFELDGSLMNTKDNFINILDECKRRMEISKELGASYIVAFPSRNDRGKFASIEDGVDRYLSILEEGKSIGVLPTIEFIGQTTQINTIEKAIKFIKLVNDPKATIIVDAFHLWRCGEIEDFEDSEINKNQISLLHVSDASNEYPRAEYKDRHRVMPGDGIVNIHKFFEIAKQKKFDGYVSLGVYNKEHLVRSPYDIAEEGYHKLKYFINNFSVSE